MSKVWDILPPPKRKGERKESKSVKKKRFKVTFFFFMLIALAVVYLAYGVKNYSGAPANPAASPQPSAASAPSTNPTGTLKILNGTGRFEETDNIKKLLSASNINVDITENALNLYTETVVYYQPTEEAKANQIVGLLSSYNAKAQKFSQETKYGIVIVIGTK